MAYAAPPEATAAAAAAAVAAPSARKLEKTKLGEMLKAKATSVTHASAGRRYFGGNWALVSFLGRVNKVKKRHITRTARRSRRTSLPYMSCPMEMSL
mmetsp:Transcript_37683/g.112850  ORF Transcript_37683/g.112850 Transcript_37683/m.112850 type:complete len:97 (+) Transcript_37683:75-365(+)